MTAEQLSVDLDTGLENHPRYEDAIAGLHRLIVEPGTRLDQLLSCLENALPASSPPALKVLAVEAVARQLGREWSDDTSSFIDVTIASTRLQDLAQALSIETADRISAHSAPFAAILLPKDEQHSLMAHLTGAFFQAFGWQHQVLAHDEPTHQEIGSVVAKANAVCIGWSNMRLRSQVKQLIHDIKLSSPDRNQPLIAGGVAALDSVEFLVEMGIDCVCDTAYSAVKIADNFNNLEKMDFVSPQIRSGQYEKTRRIDWRNP
ncbi:cobalamin-binding protein [Roseibium sp. HPY-6]|uniref:cobalamin-binding protein n=1 Tax=Roseibium sp. HPY-6 TaxID=3229852 RepID=UPI00339015E6